LYYDLAGERVNHSQFRALMRDFSSSRFVFFSPTAYQCENARDRKYANLWNYSFCKKDASEVFRRLHPPAYVYTWYARELANMIIEQKRMLAL
jgi:hypothetical protein